MNNKRIYESPEMEVIEIAAADLLDESSATGENYNGDLDLPWDNL